jgi:hypothetical protein
VACSLINGVDGIPLIPAEAKELQTSSQVSLKNLKLRDFIEQVVIFIAE